MEQDKRCSTQSTKCTRIMKLSLLTTASSQSKMNHFFLPDESVDEQFLRIVGEVDMVIGSKNGS